MSESKFSFSAPVVTDSSTKNADAKSTGGKFIDLPGSYHVQLIDVDFVEPEFSKEMKRDKADKSGTELYEGHKAPFIKLTFEVLHGVEGQSPEGTVKDHRIYVGRQNLEPLTDGGRAMLDKAAYRIGVLKKNEAGDGYVHYKTGETEWVLTEFEDFKNSEYIVLIDKPEGSKYTDIRGHNFWPVDHPEVASVAKAGGSSEAPLPAAEPATDPSLANL